MREMLPLHAVVPHRLHPRMGRPVHSSVARTLKVHNIHSIHQELLAQHRGDKEHRDSKDNRGDAPLSIAVPVPVMVATSNALSSVKGAIRNTPHSRTSVHHNHRMLRRSVLHVQRTRMVGQVVTVMERRQTGPLLPIQAHEALVHRTRPDQTPVLTPLAVHTAGVDHPVRRVHQVALRGAEGVQVKVHAQEQQHHVHRNDERRSKRNQPVPSPFLLRLW